MLIIRAQTQHSRRGRQFRDCPAINGACEVAFFTISKFSIASLFTLTAEYKGIVGRLPPPIENINGDAVVIYHGANRGKLATFLCHSSHKPAQIHSIAPRFIHADAQCTRQFGENVRDLLRAGGHAVNWSRRLADVTLLGEQAHDVMLVALQIIVGMQMMLGFLAYDIAAVPRRPLHRLLVALKPGDDTTP